MSASKEPLGILGQHIWPPVPQTRKSALLKSLPIEEKESYKWLLSLRWTHAALSDYDGHIFIVGDREGDFYEHFAAQRLPNMDLVVRLLHKHRNLEFDGIRLSVLDVLPKLTKEGEKNVEITARKGQKARTATLCVHRGSVTMPASRNRKGDPLVLSIVWAIETNPPEKTEPLEWFIFSSLPVEDLADALFVLDVYVIR